MKLNNQVNTNINLIGLFGSLLCILLLMTACQNVGASQSDQESSAKAEEVAPPLAATNTPSATNTLPPTSTSTPEPTATQVPPTVTPTPEPTSTEVPTTEPSVSTDGSGPISIKTEDGLTLAGFITYPDEAVDKEIALILGHEHDSNYHSWDPLVADLTEIGYSVLAFDFRGQGESEGAQDFTKLVTDTNAVISYLNREGFDRIACMGSSMGGTGCLGAALDHPFAGLVMVSAPMNIQKNIVSKDDLAKMVFPKLVIVAENDSATYNTPDFVDDILKMYEWMAEPKTLFLDPGFIHGAGLLYGTSGVEAKNQLIEFLSAILDE